MRLAVSSYAGYAVTVNRMARPQTKGEMIGVRLPLDVDQYVRQRAQAHEESPGEYLVRNIERWFQGQIAALPEASD